ncbi:hypothetical protein U9M48_014149 [Paspalum notatum var. saurae]|uniref:Uncharacterized protein n=1 Tax=Paspalum notatum var. saurae TaxID=547442 RepID=A0AAQ3T1Y5_PASNO
MRSPPPRVGHRLTFACAARQSPPCPVMRRVPPVAFFFSACVAPSCVASVTRATRNGHSGARLPS